MAEIKVEKVESEKLQRLVDFLMGDENWVPPEKKIYLAGGCGHRVVALSLIEPSCDPMRFLASAVKNPPLYFCGTVQIVGNDRKEEREFSHKVLDILMNESGL